MSTPELTSTLADLVIDRPELATTFDRLGLDYCCGGQRPLGDAVSEAGLELDTVIAALVETAPTEAGPVPTKIDELVDHLEATHHAYLTDALPRLVELGDKVAGVHGENHPELIGLAKLVHEIRADLEPHLLKEERVLFPMIRELAAATATPSFHCGSLNNPISVMLTEHDSVGELLAKIRAQADDFQVPADGCASYHALYAGLAELEADTHVHVHKENNLLFPAVVEAEQALAGVR